MKAFSPPAILDQPMGAAQSRIVKDRSGLRSHPIAIIYLTTGWPDPELISSRLYTRLTPMSQRWCRGQAGTLSVDSQRQEVQSR